MYGYDTDSLMHIKDNTPDSVKIAIYIIMLLLIYITYQIFLILWDTKRMDQLLGYKRKLKKHKQENNNNKNTQTEKIHIKTSPADDLLFSEEEQEILKTAGRL